MKHAAILVILLVLASCYGLDRVDELRKVAPAPSAFHQEAARFYLAFVDNELDKYDWDSAGYFAGKGLEAAKGAPILPEDPALWSIPNYAREELMAARQRVMEKLTPSYMAQSPREAASLLFHFDCWVEEQEEAWETAAIEACKQGVYLRFTEVDAPVPTGAALSTSYLFHFPEGNESLDGLAREELSLMTQTLSQLGGEFSVLIHGHADLAGNATLSKQRAEFVRAKLLAGGVTPSRIRYRPYSDAGAGDALASDGTGQRFEIFIE